MGRPGSPRWKQMFDTVEGRVGPSLDELMKRDDIVTAIVLTQRTRSEIDRQLERVSRRVLHRLNLPAGSDVNRLLAHIARLEREVSDLRNQLADRENVEFLATLEERHRTGTRTAGAKKVTAKKAGAKKATARKAVAKKATTAKKATAKKATARKAAAKKAGAGKAGRSNGGGRGDRTG